MSLTNWLDNGWLEKHKTSPQEISEMLSIADRDLTDCNSPGLSPDWQLSISYNAALQAATAALATSGYRVRRQAHHYRVIRSLEHTIKAEPNIVNQFDKFRKKRNIGGYEAAGRISQHEANEMKSLAKKLKDQIVTWLNLKHLELMGAL